MAAKSGNPAMIPSTVGVPMLPLHSASFMEETDVGKAFTQVISMALNESKSPVSIIFFLYVLVKLAINQPFSVTR